MKSILKSSPLIERVKKESTLSKSLIKKHYKNIGKIQNKLTFFSGDIFNKIIFLKKYRRFKKGGLKQLRKGYKYLDVSSTDKMLDLTIQPVEELERENYARFNPPKEKLNQSNIYALIKKRKENSLGDKRSNISQNFLNRKNSILEEPSRESNFEFVSSEPQLLKFLPNSLESFEASTPKNREFSSIPSSSILNKTAFINKKIETLSSPRKSDSFGFKRFREYTTPLLFDDYPINVKDSYKEKLKQSNIYALIKKRKENSLGDKRSNISQNFLNRKNSTLEEPSREFNFEFVSSEPQLLKFLPNSLESFEASTPKNREFSSIPSSSILNKTAFINKKIETLSSPRKSDSFGFKRFREYTTPLLFDDYPINVKDSYKEKLKQSNIYALIKKRKENSLEDKRSNISQNFLNRKNGTLEERSREPNFEFVSSEPQLLSFLPNSLELSESLAPNKRTFIPFENRKSLSLYNNHTPSFTPLVQRVLNELKRKKISNLTFQKVNNLAFKDKLYYAQQRLRNFGFKLFPQKSVQKSLIETPLYDVETMPYASKLARSQSNIIPSTFGKSSELVNRNRQDTSRSSNSFSLPTILKFLISKRDNRETSLINRNPYKMFNQISNLSKGEMLGSINSHLGEEGRNKETFLQPFKMKKSLAINSGEPLNNKVIGGYREFLMSRLNLSSPYSSNRENSPLRESIDELEGASRFYVDFIKKSNTLNRRIEMLERRNISSKSGLNERGITPFNNNLTMSLSHPKVEESKEVKYARTDRHEGDSGDEEMSQSSESQGGEVSKSTNSSSEDLDELSMKLFQRLKSDIALEYTRAGR